MGGTYWLVRLIKEAVGSTCMSSFSRFLREKRRQGFSIEACAMEFCLLFVTGAPINLQDKVWLYDKPNNSDVRGDGWWCASMHSHWIFSFSNKGGVSTLFQKKEPWFKYLNRLHKTWMTAWGLNLNSCSWTPLSEAFCCVLYTVSTWSHDEFKERQEMDAGREIAHFPAQSWAR